MHCFSCRKDSLAEAPESCDRLLDAEGEETFTLPRVPGPTPNGTGCPLSAPIAARLARGEELRAAVRGAKALGHAMIAASRREGGGRPLLDLEAG